MPETTPGHPVKHPQNIPKLFGWPWPAAPAGHRFPTPNGRARLLAEPPLGLAEQAFFSTGPKGMKAVWLAARVRPREAPGRAAGAL